MVVVMLPSSNGWQKYKVIRGLVSWNARYREREVHKPTLCSPSLRQLSAQSKLFEMAFQIIPLRKDYDLTASVEFDCAVPS